jgi:transposase
MTRKDRKRFSKEFKLEAVRRSYESGKPVTEEARELDISVHHLYQWRDKVQREGTKAFPGHHGQRSPNEEKNELNRLRKENALLREERDVLKKSLIFFAAEDAKNSALSARKEVEPE